MADEEAGRRAIAELHNQEYGGRPLTVNEAQARPGGF